MKRTMSWALILFVLLLVGILATLAFFPGFVFSRWLSTRAVVAHALAFPLAMGSIGVACGVGALGFAGLRVMRGRPHAQGLTSWFWILLAVLGVVTFASSIRLSMPPGAATDSAPQGRTLTVLTWNTHDGNVETQLGKLLEEHRPDIVVLPETNSSRMARFLALSTNGPQYDLFERSFASRATSIEATLVLVSRDLGAYRLVEGPQVTFDAVHLVPDKDPSLPAIVGVHTAPPLPGLMDAWRTDLQLVAQMSGCANSPDVPGKEHISSAPGGTIVAGDVNATMRHGALAQQRGCTDASSKVTPSGKNRILATQGTWPASLPAVLRSPIDHVLLSGPLTPLSAQVLPTKESDHNPLLVTVGAK
ncbi:MAG: endonuclease/exonuclease/phosphatase family protein [Actinomycetaceae bacterium]|nr:endonuclease/exonuclease/phosphatase family protein [Actinomycetaceae bacterium]